MADLKKIQFLRTKIKGKQPTTDQVAEGELAINLVDRSLFTNDGNKIISLGFAKGGDVDGNINQVGDFKTTGVIETSKGGAAVKLTSPSHSYIEFYGGPNNTRFAYLGKASQSEDGVTLSKDGGASLSLYKNNARLTKPLSVADQITVTTDETTDILGSHKITLIDKGVQTGELTLPKETGTLATLNHVASRIVDSLDSTDATKILSANMGSVIDTRLKEQDPRQWGFGSASTKYNPDITTQDQLDSYIINNSESHVFRADGLPKWQYETHCIFYSGSKSSGFAVSENEARFLWGDSRNSKVSYLNVYTDKNTSIDPNGFLRASGSKITLTTSNLVQTTGVATQNVMSQKAVTEALDKKVNLTGGTMTGNINFTGEYPSIIFKDTKSSGIDWVDEFNQSKARLDYSDGDFSIITSGSSFRLDNDKMSIFSPVEMRKSLLITKSIKDDVQEVLQISEDYSSAKMSFTMRKTDDDLGYVHEIILRRRGDYTNRTLLLPYVTGTLATEEKVQEVVDELNKKVNLDGSNIMTGRLENTARGEAIKLSNASHSYIGFYNEENGTKLTGWVGKPSENKNTISICKDGGASLDVGLSSIGINSTLFVTKNKDTHREIIIKEEGSNAILSVKLAATPSLVVRKPDNETYYNITIPYVSGSMAIEGTTPSFNDVLITSDKRAKDNIKFIDNPLERLNKLSGSTFTYKQTGDLSGGIIAQDLLNALPEAVDQSDPNHLKVHYNAVIGLLVNAVNELSDRVKKLEK